MTTKTLKEMTRKEIRAMKIEDLVAFDKAHALTNREWSMLTNCQRTIILKRRG